MGKRKQYLTKREFERVSAELEAEHPGLFKPSPLKLYRQSLPRTFLVGTQKETFRGLFFLGFLAGGSSSDRTMETSVGHLV